MSVLMYIEICTTTAAYTGFLYNLSSAWLYFFIYFFFALEEESAHEAYRSINPPSFFAVFYLHLLQRETAISFS